mmetsp:Transcript_32305/g.78105  ORF Transcript_32305/g.78105 Transcript_32305/m.78105 type:complete len:209 (+) Transcript_32305:1784-2410(+)
MATVSASAVTVCVFFPYTTLTPLTIPTLTTSNIFFVPVPGPASYLHTPPVYAVPAVGFRATLLKRLSAAVLVAYWSTQSTPYWRSSVDGVHEIIFVHLPPPLTHEAASAADVHAVPAPKVPPVHRSVRQSHSVSSSNAVFRVKVTVRSAALPVAKALFTSHVRLPASSGFAGFPSATPASPRTTARAAAVTPIPRRRRPAPSTLPYQP